MNSIPETKRGNFCSAACVHESKKTKIQISCTVCNKLFYRKPSEIKSDNLFCSQSCAAKYNNTHKTSGTKRSKLEIYLEQQLIQLYPNLEIHFNRKDTIDSELDIYIPLYKLAFELNGIFHYEPIFGQDKLQSIQNNDSNKFMKCQERQISLYIIDTSTQRYFKKATSDKYLKIITTIIDQYLAGY